MKIIHITWGLSFGGIETMLVNIANEQALMGEDVELVIINESYEPSLLEKISPKVKIKFLYRKLHSRNLWWIAQLNFYLYREKPNAIHLHRSSIYPILFRQLQFKCCVTLHDLPYGKIKRSGLLYRLLPFLNLNLKSDVIYIDKIPQVFSISEAVAEALLKGYGVASTVIANGINTSNFKNRHEVCYNPPLRIVQVGRLNHQKKGQDLLIRAAAVFEGRIQVDFIGDGESMPYLEQLTRELNVSDYIRFIGKQTQSYIADHLQNYDLFVHPARFEGFGLTVAEAMAASVPVLVSAGQGPAEVTCGEKYGWLFENGNVDDLVKQISCILSHYDQALEKAIKGKSYVVNTYDVYRTAKQYIISYKK